MKKTFVDIRDLASFNSLYRAFQLVSKGKKGDRPDVIEYAKNLTCNLKSLSKRLISGEWNPDEGRSFRILSEDKYRDIHVVIVEDRIVHQALDHHLGKAIKRRFVRRTYGSIKNRGTLKASKQIRRDIRKGYPYVIKIDVKKYYSSVSKQKLKELTRRKICGEAVLRLNDKIIDSFNPESGTGISIGSLPSGTNGNWYLTYFDYMCLQISGCYARYVDDVVIMCDASTSSEIETIKKWLCDNLYLELGMIEFFPISSRKIDFCMYQHDRNGVTLRKRVLKKFIRKLRDFTKRPPDPEYERNCVCSYMGFLKYCDSFNIIKQLRHEYSEVFNRVDGMSSRSKRKRVNVARSAAWNE